MTENVVIAIITAAASIIAAIAAAAAVILSKQHETHKSVHETHTAVNGRLQELLDVTKELARAQGIEMGRKREREDR